MGKKKFETKKDSFMIIMFLGPTIIISFAAVISATGIFSISEILPADFLIFSSVLFGSISYLVFNYTHNFKFIHLLIISTGRSNKRI